MINLNLIPGDKKSNIKQQILYSQIKKMVIYLSVFMFIVLASVITSKYILSDYHEEISTKIEEISKTSNQDEIDAQIKEINSRLAFIKQIQDDHINWPQFLIYFYNLIPENVSLTNLSFDNTELSVTMNGVAADRDDLINFEDNFNASPAFTDIDIPFSSLLEKENIKFEIVATYEIENINQILNEEISN